MWSDRKVTMLFVYFESVFCRIQWIVHFIWRREPVDSEKGEKGGTGYYLSWGDGGRGIRMIFIMSRQDLPDDPPMRICYILMLPPTPLPLMDAILVSCRKSPFIKSGFAANFYLYRYPVILQNLSLSLVLWWRWYLWKCKWFFNWSYSAFWMSVVKPKPKQLQQPIIARKSSQEPMRTLRKNKQTARNAGNRGWSSGEWL